MAHRQLGQIFIDLGFIDEPALEKLLIEQQEQHPDEMIGRSAMEADLITDVQLAEALAEQMGLQVVKLEELTLNADVLAQVTEPMAQLYRIVPLSLKDNVLTIAMCDPQKLSILDELRTFLGYEVRSVVATEQSVTAALDRYYASSSESFETLVADMEDDDQLTAAVDSAQGGGPIDLTSVEAIADSVPVRKLLNMVLLLAIKDRASDLHFEPFEEEFRIRCQGGWRALRDGAPAAASCLCHHHPHQSNVQPRHRRAADATGWADRAGRGRASGRFAGLGVADNVW